MHSTTQLPLMVSLEQTDLKVAKKQKAIIRYNHNNHSRNLIYDTSLEVSLNLKNRCSNLQLFFKEIKKQTWSFTQMTPWRYPRITSLKALVLLKKQTLSNKLAVL